MTLRPWFEQRGLTSITNTLLVVLRGDGFMDFIHRPKSKILKY
jgi:hypothetical protein